MQPQSRSRSVVILVTAIAAISVTARLGYWQLSRATQKEAMQRSFDERSGMPPLAAADLVGTDAAAAGQHYRPVRLRGRWLIDKTIFLDNRPMDGRTGFIVVTPLQLQHGSDAVLVQRGWIARNSEDRTHLHPFSTPNGTVEVQGWASAPPSRLFDFAGAASGSIRQNVDIAGYASETGLALYPLSVLQADSPSTSGDGLLRQWPKPALDIHKHHGYAAQWFALAALIAGLYVWFQIIQPRLRSAR